MAIEYIDPPIRQTPDQKIAFKIEYLDEAPTESSKIEYLPDEPSASAPLRATAPTGQAAGQENIEARLEQRKTELAADAERAQLPTVSDIGKGLLSGFSGALADTGQMIQQGRRLSDPLYLAGKAAKYIGEKTGNSDVVQRGAQLEAAAGTAPQVIQDKLTQVAEKNGLMNTAAAVRTVGDLLSGKEFIRRGEEDTKTLMDSMTRGGREPSTLLGQVLIGTAQSAPSTLMAAIPSVAGTKVLQLMKVAPKVASLLQKAKVSKRIAQAVGDLAESAIPASGVEGGQAGFQNARQTQRQIEEMPIETLADHPEFKKALSAADPTLPEIERMNQARQQVAKEAADYILALTTPTTGGIGLLTGGAVLGRIASKGKTGLISAVRKAVGKTAEEESIDQALRAGVGRRVAQSLGRKARGAIEGGIEEMAQETPQSGMEQVIQNLAVKKYANQDQSVTEGAGQQALVGGLSGGLLGVMGGGAAAFGAEPVRPAVIPVTSSANPEAAPLRQGSEGQAALAAQRRTTEGQTAEQVGAELLQGINSPEELDAARAVIQEEIDREKYGRQTTDAGRQTGLAGAMMPEQDLVNVLGAALQKKQAEAGRQTTDDRRRTGEDRAVTGAATVNQAVEAVRQGAGSPADEANKAALETIVAGSQTPEGGGRTLRRQGALEGRPPAEEQTQDFPPVAGQSKIETVPAPSTQPIREPPAGAVPNGEAGSGPTLQGQTTDNGRQTPAGKEAGHAITEGEQPGGNLGEHKRIAPGQNIPANQTQIQQGKGEQAGGGDRPGAGQTTDAGRQTPDRTGERVAPAEPAKYRVHKGLVAEEVAKQQSRIDHKIDAARKGLAYIESNQLVPNKEAVIQQRQAAIAELEQKKMAITPATVEEDLWKKKSRLIQERDKRWKKQFPTELGREVKRMGLRPNRTPDGRGWLEEEEFNERVPKEFRNYETGKPLDEAIPTLKSEGYLVEGTEEELQRKLGFDRELAAKGVTEDKYDEQQAMAWQDNEADWFERGSEVIDQGNLGVGSHWTEQGRVVTVTGETSDGLVLSDGSTLPIVDVGDPAGQVRIDKGSLAKPDDGRRTTDTSKQTPETGRKTEERPKMPTPASERKTAETPNRDFFGKEVSKKGILPKPTEGRPKMPSPVSKRGQLAGALEDVVPLSEQEKTDILTRFDIPEVREARAFLEGKQETAGIDTPERRQLRETIARNYLADPNTAATKHERKLFIVMGLPGAGKSKVIVDALVKKHGASVIDADIVKRQLPEYDGGRSAGLVHHESAEIAESLVFPKAIKQGDNIVMPLVGRGREKIRRLIEDAREAGYETELSFVNVDMKESVQRTMERFIQGEKLPDGTIEHRFFDPIKIMKYGLTPLENYRILTKERGVKRYDLWNNQVARGTKATLVQSGDRRGHVNVRGNVRPETGEEIRSGTDLAGTGRLPGAERVGEEGRSGLGATQDRAGAGRRPGENIPGVRRGTVEQRELIPPAVSKRPEQVVAEPAKTTTKKLTTDAPSSPEELRRAGEDAQYQADLAAMRKKLLGQVSMGLDPEIAVLGTKIAAYHVKRGVRQFSVFATAVKQDMADVWDRIKDHLRTFWEATAVEHPEIAEVSRFKAGQVIRELDGVFGKTSLSEAKPKIPAPVSQREIAKAFQEGGRGAVLPDRRQAGEQKRIHGLVDEIVGVLERGESLDNPKLTALADQVFGGTRGEGKYEIRDAYDAMEAAVNKYIEQSGMVDFADPQGTMKRLNALTERLARQTDRTTEQIEFQQFSTPPGEAFLAVYAAGIWSGTPLRQGASTVAQGVMADKTAGQVTVLEPSAGTGNLATMARIALRQDSGQAGGRVITNEISERRRALLEYLGFETLNLNAEQLNNLMPADMRPDMVVMNPPFSSTGGRVTAHDTKYGARHIEQALLRLKDGGRLVAIGGNGMAHDKVNFADWWRKIEQKYRVRANVGINGKAYGKYGTGFDNQIMVIDKDGISARKGLTNQQVADSILKGEGLMPDAALGILGPLGKENVNERITQQPEPAGNKPAQEDLFSARGGSAYGGNRPFDFAQGRPLRPGGRKQNADISAPQPVNDGPGGRIHPATQSGPGGDRLLAGIGQPNQPGPGRPTGEGGGIPAGERGLGTTPEGSRPAGAEGLGAGPDRNVVAPGTVRGPTSESGRDTQRLKVEAPAEKRQLEEEAGTPYTRYQVQKAIFAESKDHPANIVESTTMAAVEPPDVTYHPAIPEEVIKEGRLSDVQMEAITYAGQRHEQRLPDGSRAEFMVGDGTGVGKGREIAGIIYDNFMQGREKAVWVSADDSKLDEAAEQDLTAVGVPLKLVRHSDSKPKADIPVKKGVFFTSYTKIGYGWKGNHQGGDRFQQLVKWLGKDFDGVIAFDEAHKMKNAIAEGRGQSSKSGEASVELKTIFPNARIVNVSATLATTPRNMGYLTRIGFWGAGTPFSNFVEFLTAVQRGGVGAMEQISRDLKATGGYVARTISYKGVGYRTLEHKFNDADTEMYNRAADVWSELIKAFDTAANNAGGGRAQFSSSFSQFYAAQQRFFLQLMVSSQVPDVLSDADRQLAAGKQVVINIFSTGEAQTDRMVSNARAQGIDLDDLDFTPRQMMVDMIERNFPVEEYEEVEDPNTGKVSKQQVLDAAGNPVLNAENVQKRGELIEKVSGINLPNNPMDELVLHYGVKNVAEMSGRSHRIEERGKAPKPRKIGGVSSDKINSAEMRSFQSGHKKVAIITKAAATGISLHADKKVGNKNQRVFYALQLSWSADEQMQAFGRVHRSFQEIAPDIVLARTNLKGQERLINTVARRLASLGAITKGGRETLGGSLFEIEDITDDYGSSALGATWRGISHVLKDRMGVLDKNNQVAKRFETDVEAFLNRIMVLQVKDQNDVFEKFYANYQAVVARAREEGRFDTGVEKIDAKDMKVTGDELIYTHPASGAKTQLLTLDGMVKNTRVSFEEAKKHNPEAWVRNLQSGMVYAAAPGGGNKYVLVNQRGARHSVVIDDYTDTEKYEKLSNLKAQKLWTEAVTKIPDTEKRTFHMITGAVFPIYDRLFQQGDDHNRVVQARLADGDSKLGIEVQAKDVAGIKQRMGIGVALAKASPQEIYDMVSSGAIIELDNGWRLKPARVHGQERMELDWGNRLPTKKEMDMAGLIEEVIEYKKRYFVPLDETTGPAAVGKLIERHKAIRDASQASPKGYAPTGQGAARFSLAERQTPDDGRQTTAGVGRGISEAAAIDALNELADVVDVGRVERVDKEADLPAAVQAAAREKGYSGQVEAVAWDGKVWVVADRIRSADHLKVKIIHEMVHLGVREALSGSELNTVLTQTLGTLGRKMELAAIARRRGLSLDKEADYRTALEELIAKISEERRSKPNVWKRFVAAIRAYLRKKGYIKTLSDNDVDWLIEKALRMVGKGQTPDARRRMPASKSEKAFSLLDKGEKRGNLPSYEEGQIQQGALAEAETRRAYESAPVDEITGQRSLLTSRRLLREVAVRIAARNRLNLQDWQRADAAASQPGPADNRATDHPEEKLVRDVRLAIDQGILPEIDLSALGIDPQVARSIKWPWSGLESAILKRIPVRTGEGIVFQSPDGKAVYKLWMPFSTLGVGERFVGTVSIFEETPEDKLVIAGDNGSLGQLLERISVLGSIGGIPTEIAGVTDSGIVVTKQPFGRTALERKLAGLVAINRARLQEIPHSVVTYSGNKAPYVTVVDDVPYLVTDLRDENLIDDTYGRERFLDPLISRIPRWVLLAHPRLAAIVETTRAAEKEAAALIDYGMARPREDIAFSLTDEGERTPDAGRQTPDQTGVDRSLADEYATILDMLERARPAISRAAGTGYAIGKAEGKEQLAERLTKTKEKMRGVLSERMAKLRAQAEERAAAAKEKTDQAILAARIGERAKGRKEAIKEGMAIGFARGEELGRTMAVEDTVKLGFQEMAREHKQRYLDALRETESKLDAMEANLNIKDAMGNVVGKKTPEQIRQTQEWVLRQIFGPERFETFRNRPQGELLSVVAAVRNVSRKELAKHYTQGLERLLEKTNPDRLLPQYRDEWKTLTEGLTPEDVSRRNWERVKDLYETLTELITHNRNEHRFVGDVRRADAQMAGEQAAVVLDKALPEIKGLERVTPARRGRVGYMMEDKTGTALTRALTLSGGDDNAVAPEILHENLRKADTAAKAFEAQTVRPVMDLLKEQKLSDGQVIEMRTALRPVQIAGETVMMTDAEKIELAAAWEDPETKVQISLAGFMPARRRGQLVARILGGTPGETADMVQSVLQTMTAEQKVIAMKMVDQLTGMAVEANKISVIRDGWEKFTKLRYWPRKVDRATTQQTIDLDGPNAINSSIQNRQSLNAMGFTKERQEHTHPVLIGDAFATFFEHAHMMSKYAKMSLAAHDALTLIGNPVFSASVRTRVGTTFLRDTRDMITRLSGLRGYKSDSPGKRVLDALTRNVAVSILWLRPTSIIYNRVGGSFLAFTELLHENPAAARRFLARTILPVSLHSADGKAIVEKLMANGYMGDRWGHDMAHVYTPLPHERAGDTTNTRFKMNWRKMQEFGLRPMAHAEMRNAIAIFKALRANGYTEEQAVEACERITRTTQNPSSALEESAFYAEIKDRSLGWMFPFLGQPVVSRNLIMRDYLRLNHAKAIDNKPEVRKARVLLASSVLGLVANIGLMLAVRAVMRKLSRPPPDDDEGVGKTVLQNLSDAAGEIMDLLVPGSGRLADMGLNMLSGKQPREMSIFAGLQRDINNGFKNLLHPHDKDDEFDDAKLWSGVMHLLEGAGAVVGGPMGGPMVAERVLKNLLMPEEPKKSSDSGPRISGPRGDDYRARMEGLRARGRARPGGR